MPNPYLTAALRAQDPVRPKRTPKTSEATAPAKAAKSAEKSDTAPSEEN
jgi:hypothetical protein